MIVTVDPKSKPCPGVERAISLAEDVLRRGDLLYAIGQLIHNRREVERLQNLGLKFVKLESLLKLDKQKSDSASFLVRTHGELVDVIRKIKDRKLQIVDATCPIVRHSMDLVDQHVREGRGIIIVGNKDHPEVLGLMARTNGCGVVISELKEAETIDFEERSLLLGQTTVNPDFFTKVRKIVSSRVNNLKIVDTTCRFIHNRQKDIAKFTTGQDAVIFIGGKNSANGRLLFQTAKKNGKRVYSVEKPSEIDKDWLKDDDRVGIFGGASTPRWQLEELKIYLENHRNEENPKGLNNNKGGNFLWWKRTKKN